MVTPPTALNPASDAEWMAYSTLAGKLMLEPLTHNMVDWLRQQQFESGEQKITVERNLNYGLTELSFPVCRRQWMIKTARRRVNDIKERVKDLPADEREDLVTDIAMATTYADQHSAHDANLLSKEWEIEDDINEDDAHVLTTEVKSILDEQRKIEAAVNELPTPAREVFRQLIFISSIQTWIDTDRREGWPVDQFDYSDVLEELSDPDKKVTFDQRLDQLPLGIKMAYLMGGVSQSSGERWEGMAKVSMSRGLYQMGTTAAAPPKRRWGLSLHPRKVRRVSWRPSRKPRKFKYTFSRRMAASWLTRTEFRTIAPLP